MNKITEEFRDEYLSFVDKQKCEFIRRKNKIEARGGISGLVAFLLVSSALLQDPFYVGTMRIEDLLKERTSIKRRIETYEEITGRTKLTEHSIGMQHDQITQQTFILPKLTKQINTLKERREAINNNTRIKIYDSFLSYLPSISAIIGLIGIPLLTGLRYGREERTIEKEEDNFRKRFEPFYVD